MITNITLPNTISSTDINVLSSYSVSAYTTNGSTVALNTIDYHSPDTNSYDITNNSTKYKALVEITVEENKEYIIDIWYYTDTFYTPTTWPTITVSCLNGNIIGDNSGADFSTTYLNWVKKSYRVIPNYGVTNLELLLTTNLGSLASFKYLISDVELNTLNLLSNPVNNIIPVSITSNLDYLSSDIIFSLKNRNNNEYICENILTNVDINKVANIDLSPFIKNYIDTKWENSLVFNNNDVNTIYESDDDSGIIPLSIYVSEKVNGCIVSAITSTTSIVLTFAQPLEENTVSVNDRVKILTLPNVTLSTSVDNMKISEVTTVSSQITKVKLVNLTGGSITYTGSLSGSGVFQIIGNTIDRQTTTPTEYKGFSVFRGSFNDYDWDNRNYVLNSYYNNILTTYPNGESKRLVVNDLELFTFIQDPKDNIQFIYLPDNTSLTNPYSVSLDTNGVDDSTRLQLEVPIILQSTTGNTSTIEIETSNGDLIIRNINYTDPSQGCGFNVGSGNGSGSGVTIGGDINDNDYVKLFFINYLGGWESFYFKKRNIVSDTERDLYYKKGTDPLYNGNKPYNGTIQNSLDLSTDLLSRKVSLWMKELFESSNVYLYEKSYGKHKLIPVNIKDSNYTSNNKNNPIRVITFSIEYSSTKRTNL